jgi:hypothetical protein
VIVAGRECLFKIGSLRNCREWAASNSRTSVIGIAPSWSTSRSVSSIALPLRAQVPRRIFSSAALAMKAERVNRCAVAPSSIAASVPVSSEIFALVPLPLLKTNGTTASTAPSASAALTRYGLRPFAGRLHGVLQGLVEGAPHRRAARQIGEYNAVATAMTVNQNAVSSRVAHADTGRSTVRMQIGHQVIDADKPLALAGFELAHGLAGHRV